MLDFLVDDRVRAIDVDATERIEVHRRILNEKRMIREVFHEIYELLLDLDRHYFGDIAGGTLEIGSGSSLLKTIAPHVVTSDVVPCEGLDRVVDAHAMPFADGELRAIFGVHVFHHLADPYSFLNEVCRVVKPGGGAVLVDPYYGPIADFVYKRLFKNETFDKNGPALQTVAGPMTDANQALTYVVFEREKAELARLCPDIEVVHRGTLKNYIRYVLSGGVNFRQLAPDWSIPALRAAERALSPLASILALHHVIVVRRKSI